MIIVHAVLAATVRSVLSSVVQAGQRMVRACAPAVNSSELTTQQLQGMGCLVTGMPLRKLETIPQLVLCTVIADLVDCVTRRTRQAVVRSLATHSRATCTSALTSDC